MPKPQVPRTSARSYALWLLGRREWSALELTRRLQTKGYSDADITECLRVLNEHGLQSDERYAHAKVRQKSSRLGNRRLKAELRQKGVGEELVEEAVAQADDEVERARCAARRFENKSWDVSLEAKVWRYLLTRGFSADAIRQTISSLKRSQDAP